MDAAEAWEAFVAFDERSKETPDKPPQPTTAEEDFVELGDKARELSIELPIEALVFFTHEQEGRLVEFLRRAEPE